MENLAKDKSNLMKAGGLLLIILSAYFLIKVFSEFRNYGSVSSLNANVITVSGHGEVQAVPDIANVYFSISKDAKTVKEAQDMVAKIEKSALESLKSNGVADKDIKTQNASFYPKYEWKYSASVIPCTPEYCPPQNGKSVITGYTASESITVKVRNTDDVGKIMQGLGALGVSDLSGPNFSIDNEDSLKAEARKEAIKDAKEKAKVLAKDLGVSLGSVISFSEGSNYAYPVMYGKSAMMDSAVSAPAPAEIPKGENTISSDVSISYEIR
jgi:uncharacterized protein YggE